MFGWMVGETLSCSAEVSLLSFGWLGSLTAMALWNGVDCLTLVPLIVVRRQYRMYESSWQISATT